MSPSLSLLAYVSLYFLAFLCLSLSFHVVPLYLLHVSLYFTCKVVKNGLIREESFGSLDENINKGLIKPPKVLTHRPNGF